jgi:acyl-CoA thioester hydrolase
MLSTSVEIRVRYEETDQMGVVYHGKYFTWFEVARVHLVDRKGFLLPVLNCAAKFRAPALFDDRLKVEARITDIPVARISLDYRVSRKDVLLAEGETTHAFVSKEGKLVRPPKGFLRGVELCMHRQTRSQSSEELT